MSLGSAAGSTPQSSSRSSSISSKIECLDIALGFFQSGSSPGLERDQLDREPHRLGSGERGPGPLRQLVLSRLSECVLELVIGSSSHLREVTLGRQYEVRLAVLVPLQALVDDLPVDGPTVLDRRKRVADLRQSPDGSGERADLFAPVRVPQSEAVARRPRHGTGAVDALDQPVAALEPEHRADLERILRRVLHHVLSPVPVVRDDLVVVAAQVVARSDEFARAQP